MSRLHGHDSATFCDPSKPHEPLELDLLTPVDLAERIRRPIKSPRGHIHNRLVLQHHGSSTNSRIYLLESVLTEQPKKGVTLFLASPLQQADNTSMCLVNAGPAVVVKAVPQAREPGTRCADDPMREIAAMQRLKHHPLHANVIHLIDCMQDDDFVYLVLPYLSGGDLYARVEATKDSGLADEEAARYLKQIAEGLLFMKQSCGLAHRDVSLENVMTSDDRSGGGEMGSTIKIIDLGMSVCVPQCECLTSCEALILSAQRCYGKPGYLAPEVVREEDSDPFASDIWSLGVCLYMMLTGRPLYSSPGKFISLAVAEVSAKLPSLLLLLLLVLIANSLCYPSLQMIRLSQLWREAVCARLLIYMR